EIATLHFKRRRDADKANHLTRVILDPSRRGSPEETSDLHEEKKQRDDRRQLDDPTPWARFNRRNSASKNPGPEAKRRRDGLEMRGDRAIEGLLLGEPYGQAGIAGDLLQRFRDRRIVRIVYSRSIRLEKQARTFLIHGPFPLVRCSLGRCRPQEPCEAVLCRAR